jgi:hypothetical protein
VLDPLRDALRAVWRGRQDLHLSLKRLPLFFFFGELNGRKKKMESFIGGEEMGAGIWRSWENLEKLKIEEFLKF